MKGFHARFKGVSSPGVIGRCLEAPRVPIVQYIITPSSSMVRPNFGVFTTILVSADHLVTATGQNSCPETTPPPAHIDCSQAKLGFFTWPQSIWMDPAKTEFIDFAAHPAVRSLSCGGDFWFNVGD
ncbi:hypothetical protein FOZ62_015348, partial [Perkinsus olseni]